MQNFELYLNKPYEQLFSSFSDNNRRNIKKARKQGFMLDENLSKDEFLKFKINSLSGKYTQGMFQILDRLIEAAQKQNVGKIWSLKDTSGNIHAALFWIQTENRSYYLSPTSNEAGKESKAMFLMVDLIIQKFAGQKHIFDFEGSNIENIARFFKSFNAEKTLYLYLTKNRLPWPLKLMKP
jgi:hypothetical protein